MKRFWICMCVVSVGWAATAHADFLCSSWGGDIYRVSETDGALVLLGASGYPGLNSMTTDGAGNYYCGQFDAIIQIDPQTGAGTEVVSFSLQYNDIRALAWAPDGDVYAIDHSFLAANPDAWLYRLDLDSGAATLVGVIPNAQVQGLTFDEQGVLYGWHLDLGLVTIDTTNAAVTDVSAAVGGTSDIQSIDFDDQGSLYGVREYLWGMNAQTGAYGTLFGGNYPDLRGMAWIPEPATMALLGLGALLLRRRR